MPEAVIVSAARSPIGRANKGSLKDFRPDDLAAPMMRAALDKIPALDPQRRSTTSTSAAGCPAARSASTWRRVVNVMHGMDDVPGATITRYCASSVQTTRMAFHAIKAGEGDVFISAGVETVSRFAKGNSDHMPDTRTRSSPTRRPRTDEARRGRPASGTTRARTGCCPTSTSRWARPPRTSRGCAASTARSSTSSASARRTSPRRPSPTASGQREITPVTTPGRHRRLRRRRPAGRRHVRRGRRSSSRCSVPTASSRPATAARSTTAPPRS